MSFSSQISRLDSMAKCDESHLAMPLSEAEIEYATGVIIFCSWIISVHRLRSIYASVLGQVHTNDDRDAVRAERRCGLAGCRGGTGLALGVQRRRGGGRGPMPLHSHTALDSCTSGGGTEESLDPLYLYSLGTVSVDLATRAHSLDGSRWNVPMFSLRA